MTFYIIEKIKNQINPSLITGEVALFLNEEELLKAKEQWIIDNTIVNELPAFDENGAFIEIAPENSILQQNLTTLPLEYETITKDFEYETIEGVETIKPAPEGYTINEELGVYESTVIKSAPDGYEINEQQDGYIELPNSTNTKYIQTILPNEDNYEYRVATDLEKNQHFNDYLNYKIDNATEASIVVTNKDNENIQNTSRISMRDYITGQHQQELFAFDFMLIQATGDLLNEFLANELIEQARQEKVILQKKKTALIEEITKDMDSQKVRYLFFNSNKPTTESQPLQTVTYEGLALLETYNASQLKISSNDDPVSIKTLNSKAIFEVPLKLLGDVNEIISQINNKKNDIKSSLESALLYDCNTEQEFDKIENHYRQTSVQDGDDIKDRFITVKIDIATYNIKIYDLTKAFKILKGEELKENTDITNIIFSNII